MFIFFKQENPKHMDIGAEKAEVIKRFEKVYDLSLIRAVKNLLDFGISKQTVGNDALEASIDRGLKQSGLEEVTPHEDVLFLIKFRQQC